jgi:hypothetical protein
MMKKEDQTIAEIRAVRLAISEKFGHDPEKIVEHYIKLQNVRSKGRKRHVSAKSGRSFARNVA